jgi:hypothetical protein
MALAAVLLKLSQLWYWPSLGLCDTAGLSPAFDLLLALNPFLEFKIFSVFTNPWCFVVPVGVFWYWIALNVSSWQRTQTVIGFSRRPTRFVADAVLISLGSCSAPHNPRPQIGYPENA